MSLDATSPTEAKPEEAVSAESSIALAKRAFALRKFEEAVEHYGTALELMTENIGDDAPELADVYFAYGLSLLENAIAQSAVLGKGETADENEANAAESSNNPRFHFGGDEEDEGAEAEDKVLDLRNDSLPEQEEDEEGEPDDDDGSPEDDFAAAWEVLDVARTIYQKMDDAAPKLKLADTYVALGDVSLETEKFDQAVSDYSTALKLKHELLPLHSRQIIEAHWKLGIVLDLTPGRLGDAVMQVEKAVASIDARLGVLRDGLQGNVTLPATGSVPEDPKGKGKATGPSLLPTDPITSLSKDEMEAEIKEFEDLKAEVLLKIEDMKASPEQREINAPALAAQLLDEALNKPGSVSEGQPSASSAPVNDLSGMVKKKKKVVPGTNGETSTNASANGKRKAEDTIEDVPEKKTKLDEST